MLVTRLDFARSSVGGRAQITHTFLLLAGWLYAWMRMRARDAPLLGCFCCGEAARVCRELEGREATAADAGLDAVTRFAGRGVCLSGCLAGCPSWMRRRGKVWQRTQTKGAQERRGRARHRSSKQEAAKGGRERGSRSSADASYMYFARCSWRRTKYRPSPVVRPPGLGPVPVLARSRPGAAAAGCWRRGRGSPAAARRFPGRLGPLGACNGASTGAPRGPSCRTGTGASTATSNLCSIPARGPASQGQAQVPLHEPSLSSSELVNCPKLPTRLNLFPGRLQNAGLLRPQELESIPAVDSGVVRSIKPRPTNQLGLISPSRDDWKHSRCRCSCADAEAQGLQRHK